MPITREGHVCFGRASRFASFLIFVLLYIAAPMIGGLVTSFLLELLVYLCIYAIWKWNFEMKRGTVDVTAARSSSP